MIRLLCAFVLVMLASGVCDAKEAERPCVAQTFEGDGFIVCTFDANREDLLLVWADSRGAALRGFAALKRELGTSVPVRYAMNAGMFDVAGAPVGLFVANGVMQMPLNTASGSGNFYLKPNGVFLIDNARRVRIETTDVFARRTATVSMATQSGPMLVIDGRLHAAFDADGPSRYVRNGVGVRDGAHAVFAISERPVSFGKFARLFRDGLGCANALYFDGAVSSLWAPSLGRMDGGYPLGPMIVIADRVPAQ